MEDGDDVFESEGININFLENIQHGNNSINIDPEKKTGSILEKYSHIRRVKSKVKVKLIILIKLIKIKNASYCIFVEDGNSYYRSLMYSFVERLIINEETTPFENFIKILSQDKSNLKYFQIRDQDKSFISNVLCQHLNQILHSKIHSGIKNALTFFFKICSKSNSFDKVELIIINFYFFTRLLSCFLEILFVTSSPLVEI